MAVRDACEQCGNVVGGRSLVFSRFILTFMIVLFFLRFYGCGAVNCFTLAIGMYLKIE